jgi:hypothetical protein
VHVTGAYIVTELINGGDLRYVSPAFA